MNTLKIQQGLTVETVTTSIINKLYEAALSISEPLEGEEDNAYLSGNILVGRASQNKVKYLAGTVLVRGAGNVNNNPTGRFRDLKINITDEYYIDFEDNAIKDTLITKGFSSDGYGVTISDAANAEFTDSTFAGALNNKNTSITKFNEFKYFTKANNNPPTGLFRYCPNFAEIDLSNCIKISHYEFCDTAIQTINAPLLQIIEEEPFNGCYELTTITSLGSTISAIPYASFINCPNLQTVNLPTTITSIASLAFYNNTNIESSFTTITGMQNITSIGNEAFKALHSLVLNSSYFPELATVGNETFYGCYNFTGELNLPKLTSIGTGAFKLCGFSKVKNLGKISAITSNCFLKNSLKELALTEVYLPYECTSIGIDAFRQNKALTTIKQYTDSIDNWVEGLTPTYSDFSRITSIEHRAFYDCTSLTTEINLPNLTTLGNGAFYNSGIIRVTNLGSITSIMPHSQTGSTIGCFENCINLTELNIPNTVIHIGQSSFFNTQSLTTFNIDYSVITDIDSMAFNKVGCNLGVMNLEDLSSVGVKLFQGSVSEAIYMPKLTTTNKGGYYSNTTYNSGLFAHNVKNFSRPTVNGIVYFRDILKFYSGDFSNCTIGKIVINNTTPPMLCNQNDKSDSEAENTSSSKTEVFANTNIKEVSGGGTIGGIYVPDAAVSTYLSNSDWSPYSLFIHPISDLSTVATKATWNQLSDSAKLDTLIEEYM